MRTVYIETEAEANAAFNKNISITTTNNELVVATVVDIDTQLEQLRDEAGRNYAESERVLLIGRNATNALMQRVYALWHEAKKTELKFDELMNNVRRKLKDLDIAVRSNSPDSSQLISYVFADASYKQVHVYGRALEVASARSVQPDAFVKLVEDTPNGYEGLRLQSVTGQASTKEPRRTPEIALSVCSNEPTFDTIEVSWDDGTAYRIYAAVLNADGTTADLKELTLSEAGREATLLKFFDEKEKLKKPTKQAVSDATKIKLAQLTSDAAMQQIECLKFQSELAHVTRGGNKEAIAIARSTLTAATNQYNDMIKSLRAMKKDKRDL